MERKSEQRESDEGEVKRASERCSFVARESLWRECV